MGRKVQRHRRHILAIQSKRDAVKISKGVRGPGLRHQAADHELRREGRGHRGGRGRQAEAGRWGRSQGYGERKGRNNDEGRIRDFLYIKWGRKKLFRKSYSP